MTTLSEAIQLGKMVSECKKNKTLKNFINAEYKNWYWIRETGSSQMQTRADEYWFANQVEGVVD